MDDFYMNPDDLNDDAQLSIVDEEKLKVLDKIEEYVKLTKDAVKFQETDEYATNFRILSRYVSAMVDLNNLDNNEIEVENDDGTISTLQLEPGVNGYDDWVNFTNDYELVKSEPYWKYVKRQ